MADDFNVADQFSGLDMSALIGGPLQAAFDANVSAAKATQEFIEQIGLEEGTGADKIRKVRSTEFAFTRSGELKKDGTRDLEQVTMNVPFLSMVKVPNLAVSEMNVTFDMAVRSTTSYEKDSSNSGNINSNVNLRFGWFGSANIKIQGSLSSSEKNTRNTDTSAKYHVDVKAVDTGMPEGLAKMLDALTSACVPTNVKKGIKEAPQQQ